MYPGSTFPSPHTIYPLGRTLDTHPAARARGDDPGPINDDRANPPRMNAAIVPASPIDPRHIPATSLPHTNPELISSNLEQSTRALSINVEPTELRPGVYIGEGRAKSGEKFYLRMEKIDARNYLFWLLYLTATDLFAARDNGVLSRLMRFTRVVEDTNGKKNFINDLDKDIVASQVGLDAKEFQELINALGQGGYFSAKAGGRKSNALLQITAASEHLALNPSGNFYITFASRCREISTTEIPSRLDADTDPSTIKVGERAYQGIAPPRLAEMKYLSEATYNIFKAMRLKDYFNIYKDLLMCVGSQFEPGKSGYSSRGIFRNPYSIIKNDYKGIAMVMHGFTGAVARKFFPDRTEMNVKPITSMQLAICETLGRDDYYIENHDDIDSLIKLCREYLASGDSFEAPDNYIKPEALARLYATHASN